MSSFKISAITTCVATLAFVTTNASELSTDAQKEGYSLGAGFGTQMREQDVDIDVETFVEGFRDALSGKDLALTDAELKNYTQNFQKRMTETMKAKADQTGTKNTAAGKAFLAENAAKEGVVVTASGLQYSVIKEGEGPKPGPTDKVTVHYTGTLLDGTVFDSSVERGQPATFPLNRVIPGWTEGLQLMNVGSKYTLYVPSDLAYGERAGSPKIGPHSTLIFEVELLSID
ncbi:MAG: FKBP-type peptidyl-prolyl cis-trans isomerase [Verrucomicrobia bacterium]|nr:FKBP-type peptidyl-prolyl cis-trans isomerase [Verrucomicrobiota bacterium]